MTLSRRLPIHLSDTSTISQYLTTHLCRSSKHRKIITENTSILHKGKTHILVLRGNIFSYYDFSSNQRKNTCKNIWGNTIDFSKVFFHQQKKWEGNISNIWSTSKRLLLLWQCFLTNTKAMVHLANGITDFFDIMGGVLQGDSSEPYL